MRVEVRLELDEHEYSVSVECDQSTGPRKAVAVATSAIEELLRRPSLDDMVSYLEPWPNHGGVRHRSPIPGPVGKQES